ncbi:hypothetical protein [Mucilaginibacter sp.]
MEDADNVYKEKASYYRGKMIEEFCKVELALERYLAAYFLKIPEERREFKNYILDRLTFEAKRTAFKGLLDKQATEDGFIKTKNNKWAHGSLVDQIKKLNDQRVYFAHYYLAYPRPPGKYVICLTEYRDTLKSHDYSADRMELLILEIKQVAKEIEELKNINLSI